MNNISFTNAQDFIDWVEHQRRFSPKVSLEKMRYYLSLFDNPHQKFSSIHITGTNGKGSVVAYLNSVLRTAGFNVATFTSPYITCFNERIRYNDQNISNEDLLRIANLILSKYDIIEQSEYDLPTFFEFITIVAFIYYSEIKDLDLAIIEVGMGGRLDSTNVITPLLSVITNVSLEHTQILGDTLEKIASEKLGIVKENSYLVSGNIDNSLVNQFDEYCLKQKTKHIQTSLKKVEIIKQDINSSIISLDGRILEIGLAGSHQIENACCAFNALNTLKELDLKWKNRLTNEILDRGFKNVKWQGRFETISKNPLIVIDGCHNIDGVKRVCDFVKNLNYSYKRAVISISADKELKEMTSLIAKVFDEIVITKYSYMRSSEVDTLNELLVHPNKKIIKSVQDALDYCHKEKCELTVFLGSLYLVSEVYNLVKPLK